MIRLINIANETFWINPKAIDLIEQSGILNSNPTNPDEQSSNIIFHSGASCMKMTMAESVDDVYKMIDEAISKSQAVNQSIPFREVTNPKEIEEIFGDMI